uniref:Charged multivesicular body protein 7 n=1 Tax=Rhabditophanes sp. KR3021 TaxID=114890 RepID=A0AC35TKP7_9BILA
MYNIEKKPYHPDDWTDDGLMSQMMSSIPNRTLNPKGYNKVINFWTNAIEDYCVKLGQPFISINDLKRGFKRGSTVPIAIGEVFKVLTGNNVLQDQGELDLPDNYSLTRLANSAKSSLYSWWTQKDPDCTKFAHIPAVKKMGKQLLEKIKERSHDDLLHGPAEVMSKDDLISFGIKSTCFNEEIIEAIIKLWVKERFVVIGENEKKVQIVKFAEDFRNGTTPPTYSQADTATFNLVSVIKLREKQINDISKNNKELRAEAAQCLRNKDKDGALRRLRKYKSTEKVIEKMETVKANLEGFLHQISLSKDNATILEIYKDSNQALKNTNKANGISVDSVDDTMMDVEETLADQNYIETAISKFAPTVDFNDADLEAEFNTMIKDTEGDLESRFLALKTSGKRSHSSTDVEESPPKRRINFPAVPTYALPTRSVINRHHKL